ncbi:hypothetical protein Glove_140g68 [Diversispora epigaea]|uniref:Protein kinase domain-containing protein n=1 Tax=Diversispora epigaea TaxID=1348612 RepID=A0A397IV70_9GLOM|nr:hypothetical protein Glove_140g68 [Diversispora epigaea]
MNIKSVNAHISKATFKISQKTVALKNIYLNDVLDDLINEIKRYRKLGIHDSILKFYGITKQENTNNYMVILEYVNEGSLRQYLKTNFQKLDWNAKLNLAKQIANVLMFLHSNDIIHRKFNSENILIHNGIIKFNIFGLTKIISDSLRFFINNLGPVQYMDSQHLELFNTIGKNKSSDIFGLGIILWEISSGNPPFEMKSSSNVDLLNNIAKVKAIPGTPHKYKEIYTDCWKQNGNLRPDISQVVKNLAEIIISDVSVDFETSQSKPYNNADEVISVKLKKSNKQNKGPEIIPDPPFVDFTTEVDDFINDLFEIFINTRKKQFRDIQSILIKNYIREHKRNSVKILFEMIRHPSFYLFTSLIGFFYCYGIGTVVDNQMAFKFFNLAANEIIDTSSFNSSSLKKLYNFNKEIGIISLAYMYFDGIGVEKDTKKAFQIYYKLAFKGSLIALNTVAYCYDNGLGVEKNEEKAFELYLKSAEKGNIPAQSNVGLCYEYGTGITKDEVKGFQWNLKSALAGNINAMFNVGCSYDNGIGVCKDEKEAFKWYLEAAEKGYIPAQSNVGLCYEYGTGITKDEVKGLQWNLKSALAGNINAIFNVGCSYDNGIGVCKDEKEAFKWYLEAAEKGLSMAQHNLGCCYKNGEGIDEDQVKAFEWFKKAAENDYSNCQYKLGECFYDGCGTKKDIVKAVYWLNRAKENGNTDAEQLLEEIIYLDHFFYY